MKAYVFAVTALAWLGSVVSGAEPVKHALTKCKQYAIQVRMLEGDPLGDEAIGSLKELASPTLVTLDNQTASFQTETSRKDGTSEVQEGICVRVTPREQKDGHILLKLVCERSERPKPTDEEVGTLEVHTIEAARMVHHGQVFKLRLSTTSATHQTWVEATVTAIKFQNNP